MSAVEELAGAIGELAAEHASRLLTLLERAGSSERARWNAYDGTMYSFTHDAVELARERTDFRVERLLIPALTSAAKRLHAAAGHPTPVTVRQRAHWKAIAGGDGVERYVAGRLRLAIEGRDTEDERRQARLAEHGLREGVGALR